MSTFEPNPHQLSDNYPEFSRLRGQEDALEAYDAEFWANEMKLEPIQELNRAAIRASIYGLKDMAWPISGDTIAAIRAAA